MALSEDLNLAVADIVVDCCDEQLGQKWTIEFNSGETFFLGRTALCTNYRTMTPLVYFTSDSRIDYDRLVFLCLPGGMSFY